MAQEFGGVAGPVAGGHPHENTAAPERRHYEEYTGEEAALQEALQRQLEYYFSRDNLSQDAFLVSQMDHDLYVPIATIASFKMVRSMTTDMDLIVHALRQSSLVQVDETNSKVRPVASLKRNTLILRELPAGTTEEEVWGLFDVTEKGDALPRPTSVRCDIGNMWFIGFETEEDTRAAFDHTHNMVFKGTSIKARIKSENLLRATSYPPKNGFKKGNSFSGPPMMVPVHDMPPEMHVFDPMAAPFPQHMDPMGYGGMHTDMYGAMPPAAMFYPGMQWMPHYHYEQAQMMPTPVPVFKPMQMHPGGGYAPPANEFGRRHSTGSHGSAQGSVSSPGPHPHTHLHVHGHALATTPYEPPPGGYVPGETQLDPNAEAFRMRRPATAAGGVGPRDRERERDRERGWDGRGEGYHRRHGGPAGGQHHRRQSAPDHYQRPMADHSNQQTRSGTASPLSGTAPFNAPIPVMNNESFPPLPTTQSAPEMKPDTKPTAQYPVAAGSKPTTESAASASAVPSKGGWGNIVKVNLQGAATADMLPRTTKPVKTVGISKEKDTKKSVAQHTPQRAQGTKPSAHPSSPPCSSPSSSSKDDHPTATATPAPSGGPVWIESGSENQGGRSYAQMLRRQNSSPTKDAHSSPMPDTHAPSVPTSDAHAQEGEDGVWEQARRNK